MRLEGNIFYLDKGEMVRTVVVEPPWIAGPAEGTLQVENKRLYATVDGKRFELMASSDVSSVKVFPRLVIPDPSLLINSEEGKKQDSAQGDSPFTKD